MRKLREPGAPGSPSIPPCATHHLMAMLRRKRERLRPLDEAAAYARCHGDRDETVRIVHLPPRRTHYDLLATGEDIRRSLEARIDGRDTEP